MPPSIVLPALYLQASGPQPSLRSAQVKPTHRPDYVLITSPSRTESRVWEIKGTELSKSTSGGGSTAGLSIRFPRLVRERDDKATIDANTLADMRAIVELTQRARSRSPSPLPSPLASPARSPRPGSPFAAASELPDAANDPTVVLAEAALAGPAPPPLPAYLAALFGTGPQSASVMDAEDEDSEGGGPPPPSKAKGGGKAPPKAVGAPSKPAAGKKVPAAAPSVVARVAAPPAAATKPVCPYGKNCYRKNPAHFVEFCHDAAPPAGSGDPTGGTTRGAAGKRPLLPAQGASKRPKRLTPSDSEDSDGDDDNAAGLDPASVLPSRLRRRQPVNYAGADDDVLASEVEEEEEEAVVEEVEEEVAAADVVMAAAGTVGSGSVNGVKRIDSADGEAYTYDEFLLEYGAEEGTRRWEAADTVAAAEVEAAAAMDEETEEDEEEEGSAQLLGDLGDGAATGVADLDAEDLDAEDLDAEDLDAEDLDAETEEDSDAEGRAPSLPAPSLPAPLLPAPSLPASSLPAPSLPAPSLPASSPPPAPSLPAPSLAAQAPAVPSPPRPHAAEAAGRASRVLAQQAGRWQVNLGGSFKDYEETVVQQQIEAAWERDELDVEVVVRGKSYLILLGEMRQVMKDDRSRWRAVRRMPASGVSASSKA